MAAKKNKAHQTVKADALGSAGKKEVRYNYDSAEPVLHFSEPELVYYKPFYTDDISLLNRSKKGLNAKAALDFLSLSGFTQDEFQETFKTTVKTIQNHVTRELTLDAALSEKLLKSFALFDKGVDIFGSAKSFHQWLSTSSYGLGNQLPFDLMDTITGIQLIEEELIRLEFGDLA
ncbi:MAG TPA: MbcA/ParS/Xre antitoxin family protein [Mucilaginibacter sp.]|jgi:putative toxin-antitoxin system antitoxin component (TIGR02293 family)